jgi:hypothetical protein
MIGPVQRRPESARIAPGVPLNAGSVIRRGGSPNSLGAREARCVATRLPAAMPQCPVTYVDSGFQGVVSWK